MHPALLADCFARWRAGSSSAAITATIPRTTSSSINVKPPPEQDIGCRGEKDRSLDLIGGNAFDTLCESSKRKWRMSSPKIRSTEDVEEPICFICTALN